MVGGLENLAGNTQLPSVYGSFGKHEQKSGKVNWCVWQLAYLCLCIPTWNGLAGVARTFLGEVDQVLWVLRTSQASKRTGQVVAGWYSPIRRLLISKGRGNGSFLKLAGPCAPLFSLCAGSERLILSACLLSVSSLLRKFEGPFSELVSIFSCQQLLRAGAPGSRAC